MTSALAKEPRWLRRFIAGCVIVAILAVPGIALAGWTTYKSSSGNNGIWYYNCCSGTKKGGSLEINGALYFTLYIHTTTDFYPYYPLNTASSNGTSWR
jgi:hypothetical protein